MKKLAITGNMSIEEQRTRGIVNHTIENCGTPDRLRNWLLEQVFGVEIDGMCITYPNTMTYEQAIGYYREATC